MTKKKSKLDIAQENAQDAIRLTNQRIQILGEHSGELYKALIRIQDLFDNIRNVPSEKQLQLEKLKEIRLSWKQQAEKIADDYENVSKKALREGASGVLAGVGVAALGPTAAMGVATTFGVASTGASISALSGAAATNAALAWLGGGALAAGGGGMAAGEALLALAGPIGWAIAGAAILASGVFFFVNKSRNDRLQNIFTLISERDVKSYELAIVELNERIDRIKDETPKLWEACGNISTYGTDYGRMTEDQQFSLGAYVNLMLSTTQLLVNPILGLQPKYSQKDLDEFKAGHKIYSRNEVADFLNAKVDNAYLDTYDLTNGLSEVLFTLANLLYGVPMEEKDCTILGKSLRDNKDFLKSITMDKESFSPSIISAVQKIIDYKYYQSKISNS